MRRRTSLILAVPVCFTLLVSWFALSAHRAAPHIATENLRGAGLSIAAAVEQLAVTDGTFRSLEKFTAPDLAYFALVDDHGVIRFHTSPQLFGSRWSGGGGGVAASGVEEWRERLGTGEIAYLLRTRVHAGGAVYRLVLALHTYRADQVIRRARAGVTVVTALTAAIWLLTVLLLFMVRRDERQRREMARRHELARLGEMGAVLAHEIRNPLAGIKGFAQLVLTARDLEQARRHADKIVTQSLRMEALVNDLLAYARDGQETRRSADLCDVLCECAALVQQEASAQGVRIDLDVPSHCLARVMVDRLVQLCLNLMKNAVQAMPDGGVLTVQLRNEVKGCRILIRDTGEGIAPENLARIFEPFWTSKAQGTGLGLALCRKVAEEHGGTLTVTSTLGAGTEFVVVVPQAT